jgi:hypothetical protein
VTPYQREGDGYRCVRHAVVFLATGSCAGCDADPGPAFDPEVSEPLPDPPKGCESTLEIERELTAELTAMRRAARAQVDRRTKRGKASKAAVSTKQASAAAKLWDTYLKGKRLQIALASRREDAEIVRRYERREAARGAAH